MLSVMGYSYIRPVHSMNGCKRRNAEQRKCCRILISIRICFLEMIAKGIALPIYQIPTCQYSIYITTEKDVDIPEDWEQVIFIKIGFLQSEQMINFAFSSFELFLKNTMI